MTRRRVHILLHWSVVLMILSMIKGGSAAPGLRWAFVVAALLWVAIAIARGPIGRPGSKLSPGLSAAYRPAHWLLYATLGVSALINGAELLGLIAPGPAWNSLIVLLFVGTFHAWFQFWRHAALNDGALRLIVPRRLHHLL